MQESLLSKKRVLIVEDNAINQLLAGNLVKNLGAEVDLALTGLEAIEKIQTTEYHLVLMDIQLPEMDGYEVTSFVRNQIKSKVPIIAMTAYALNGENEKCLQHGMNGYVAKPFSQKDLCAVVEKVLESNSDTSQHPYILSIEDVMVDISILYEVAGDEEEYINAMVSTFLETIPVTIKKMEDSFAAEDYDTLAKSAHYSKSSLSIIKISNAYDIAQKIEKSAKSKTNISELAELIKTLKEKIRLAQKALIKKFGEGVKVA